MSAAKRRSIIIDVSPFETDALAEKESGNRLIIAEEIERNNSRLHLHSSLKEAIMAIG